MLDAASWAGRLGGDTFLAQTYHRSYAHFPGTADTAGLFSWDDLNRIIATQRLEPPRLRLSADGEMVPLHRYAIPTTNRRAVTWSRIQPADFHAQLKDGASLVLDAVEKIHPAVGMAAEGLERFLGTSVQANAYASWTDREGFGLHWDDHDVVVVQVHGSKRWRLYGSTREAPTFRDVESPESPEGDPVADIVLAPGDVLYLPRGWWHAVMADQGTESLHLTFGMVPHTGADLMLWVVDQLRSSLALRKDIPRFASLPEQSDFIEAVRREVLDMMADPRLVERWAESIDTTDLGHAIPSLPYVDGLPARPEITVKLTAPRGRLTANPAHSTVTFSAAGTAWDFAEFAAPALGTLLIGQPVTLSTLADSAGLDVKDVAELVWVLIEGQAAAVVGTGL
ncbi:cupin domain-containing protein [Streptomyces xanthophaeus]|uniref:JmjC domain-containing protein n=1 Tax=Streptomyces xanthophaeus TaxID=67385 RepID=UPI0004CCA522|nr:cupin domain-containing protein [Streptomyces xanthophaeus]WST25538.1 cupin domain-containing protein [Streptomyces xanthophaeus]WST59488.1 cupin domain-containing protein [Streptomyces xanthophaeus]